MEWSGVSTDLFSFCESFASLLVDPALEYHLHCCQLRLESAWVVGQAEGKESLHCAGPMGRTKRVFDSA